MKIATRRNMGKITQFRGWVSSIFLNVESPTAPIESARTSQQIRVRRSVETVRLILFETILFNNVSRVNVVEQIPTAFCSTTFSNNNYTCDPRNVWWWWLLLFCTRIIRVCTNIFMEIAVELQISNISTLKRCNLQFTTWNVVPNEIFGPWMSRRGQGWCSNLVKNMLT